MSAMLFYGLGTIIGAGIYVLIGEVIGLSGSWAPFTFLIAAVVAAFTGISYAELVSRHPRCAGEAEYVFQAFGSRRFSRLIGVMVVFTGLVSAATLARGFSGYAQVFLSLPTWSLQLALLVVLSTLASLGASVSVRTAVTITVIEVLGLLLISGILIGPATDAELVNKWIESLESPPWAAIAAAAFLAFYAFIGFEDMVSMAEEVKDVRTSLPKAIILALVISTLIYLSVAALLIIVMPNQEWANSSSPLATALEGRSTWLTPQVMALISLIAIINGVMVQLLMASRVIYGLSRDVPALGWIATLHPKWQTPVRSTILVACVVFAFSVLLNLKFLASITSFLILIVFIFVNLSLIRLKKRGKHDGFEAHPIIPWLGVISSALLILSQVLLTE